MAFKFDILDEFKSAAKCTLFGAGGGTTISLIASDSLHMGYAVGAIMGGLYYLDRVSKRYVRSLDEKSIAKGPDIA